jgi:protein LTV1
VSALSIRNRHETLEEKKARKNAIKELRRERRIEKKANKLAFKEEQTRQEKMAISSAKNAKGIKLL